MLAAALGADFESVAAVRHGGRAERSQRIALEHRAGPRAGPAPLDEVARLIAGASFVVGVDTGLMHLAAALGVPLVAIFAASEPGLTGPMGAGRSRCWERRARRRRSARWPRRSGALSE